MWHFFIVIIELVGFLEVLGAICGESSEDRKDHTSRL